MKGESQAERDKRIRKLWESLDTRHEGQLDLKAFQQGLRRIDHPLKNADGLLRNVLEAVDTSGDGKIQFNEFQTFVKRAENELWLLFKTIDHDRDGNLDKEELRNAFTRADITVPSWKIEKFFEELDKNNDGVISFEEWRDFMLFLPADSSSLRSALSYYAATGNLNPEGDVQINQPFAGTGTAHLSSSSWLSDVKHTLQHLFPTLFSDRKVTQLGRGTLQSPMVNSSDDDPFSTARDPDLEWLPLPAVVYLWVCYQSWKQTLTESTPHLGYFIAGGMAGAVSRTATAPLDRLKVYLIAQTNIKSTAANVTKSGSTLQAVSLIGRPLVEATKELWRAGGVRSLFAGNGLNVAKVMPESAIKFGAYEASKRMFARLEGHNDPKDLLPVSQFLSGGVGGMVSQCFVYPLDTLKFRMQCEVVEGGLRGNQLIASTAKTMWTSNGIFAFFRGLPLGLIGMFPFAAIDLMTFEYLKSTLVTRKARLNHCHEDDAPLSNFSTGAIGAFSGALSASSVYPLNVLRTRLQTQGTVLHQPTYTGIVDVTRKTFQSEGFRGFYRGLSPNLLKVVPSVSISYVVYENSKALLGLS